MDKSYRPLLFLIVSLIWLLGPGAMSSQAGDETGAKYSPKEKSTIPILLDSQAEAEFWTPPYKFWLLQTDQVGTIFSNSGTFGTGFVSYPVCDGEICPSFESPSGSDLEYLFGGAIWLGGIVGSDTLVSTANDGWYMGLSEYVPTHTGHYFDGLGERSAWTLFYDTVTDPRYSGIDPYDGRLHHPLYVRVANRAYAWDSSPLNNAIIYDLVITNIGQESIQDGFIAFLIDADVSHWSNMANGFYDDITGVLRNHGIAYIIDNDGDPVGGQFAYTSPTRLFAFKFLGISQPASDTGYNWWISNGNPDLDFGPQPVDEFGAVVCDFDGRTGTPTGDIYKYCIISHSEWDYDQFRTADSMPGWTYPRPAQAVDYTDGYDTRFLMSLGPFNLMPDSSVRILYTFFTGDSVIQVPGNLANLPDDPDQYFANLDFTQVIANADAAESMVSQLINPNKPTIGLYVQHNDADSVVIEWDPWGYQEVIGYNIYFYEIPYDSLPYPGIAPPWIKPTAYDLEAEVGQTYRYKFESLSLYGVYMASVANRTETEAGEPCFPVQIQPAGRPPAPVVDNEYSFIQPGDPAVLGWTEPEGIDIDHYNIYRFDDPQSAAGKYYPLYDRGEFKTQADPADSFFVEDQWYFYYAMEPYAQVDAGVTNFAEYTKDSTVYAITAVAITGLESDFSPDITVLEIPLRTKDILVVICRLSPSLDFATCDSVLNFYDSVLWGYDYDIYNMYDTTKYTDFGPDKFCMDIMPYRLAIFDGSIRQDILRSSSFYETVAGTEKYLWSGGILINCGSMIGLSPSPVTPPEYNAYYNSFVSDLLGIDSIFNMKIDYYLASVTEDTIMGMVTAESVYGAMPQVTFDGSRSVLRVPFWDDKVAPCPATFRNNENGEVTHVLRSLYPEKSWVEGDPVGVRRQTRGTLAYTFGFHLYYMNYDDARAIIDYVMAETEFYAAAKTSIEPGTVDFREPIPGDPTSGAIYLGNLTGGYSIYDIDQMSLQINHAYSPATIDLLSSFPDYDGPVMKLNFPLSEFCDHYGFIWGTSARPYRITGFLTNGFALSATGYISMVGYVAGDANEDNMFNIADAVFLVNYMYRSGPAPDPTAPGDANGDCVVDTGDIIWIINSIFKRGAPPLEGCAP